MRFYLTSSYRLEIISNHLFRIATYIIHTLGHKSALLSSVEVGPNLLGLTLTTGVHGAYALFTEKEEEIQIVEKYQMNRFGFTDFMVVDTRGRHFNVNNSIWYWKWDSIEDWSSLHKGDTLTVKYYGWRKHVFGLFPNIVHNDPIHHK